MTTLKTIYNKVASVAIFATLAGSMASCVSETPFADEGEVLVKMNVMMNSAVTRAEDETIDQKLAELYEKCVVTVRKDKDVLHQWRGAQNIPGELYMRYGEYTAEAWSGDSVPASLESEGKKYYKGQEKFTVNTSSESMQVILNCTLANVVASVDEETINNDYVKKETVKVIFSHTKGSITLGENWADKCYFMMPNNDHNIAYKIEGKSASGTDFTKEGVIENVQSAHEYRLFFEYNPSESTNGGAFIEIVVEDKPVSVESVTMDIIGRPEFMWSESGLNVGDQIVNVDGTFIDHHLTIAAYNGFKSVRIYPDAESEGMFDNYLPTENGSHAFDLVAITKDGGNAFLRELESKGITVKYVEENEIFDENTTVKLCKYTVSFSKEWLNGLPKSENEYMLNVEAEDVNKYSGNNGKEDTKTNSTKIRIANTESAIVYPDPIVINFEGFASDLLNVRSTYVTIPIMVPDASVENLAVQYRKVGDSSWTSVPVVGTRALSENLRLEGLTPGTKYEFRGVAGALTEDGYEFVTEETGEFTTDSKFTIPNASMEDWSNYSENSKVLLPAAGGERTFWDTGNHGSATMSKLITNPNTDIKHSGERSVELKSQFVGVGTIGKFAAGNLFAGIYVRTDGTDGVLKFGREYDGSHPSGLSVWVNYRPGKGVNKKGANDSYIKVGALDEGQIYIALTTSAVDIRTKESNRKLFDPNGKEVVAYGQVTFTENIGSDNELVNVKIPFEYYDKAKTEKPTHLVIVCSASKYGDYFSGGEGSVLYLDDFELVYE